MSRLLTHPWLLFELRVVLGGLFVYAGVIKFFEPTAFTDNIASYQLLPASLINLVAIALPPLEIIIGALLIAGTHTRLAAFATAVLCVAFLVALIQALARGINVDCGCFGSGEPSTVQTLLTVVRDIILLTAAAWLYSGAFHHRSEARQHA